MPEYVYHTEPFKHQREGFERSKDMEFFALFWEQGTGKTKTCIDTAAYLFEQGKLDTVLVVAPNGVYQNWRRNEFTAHFPPRLYSQTCAFTYQTKKARTKAHEEEARRALAHTGLLCVFMSYDALLTNAGAEFIKKLTRDKKRNMMVIIDEAHHVKNYSAQRSKYVRALTKHAKYRRILTGTPVANNPFDLYSPVMFLHPTYWKQFSIGGIGAFRHHFGIWEKGFNGKTGREFETCIAYKNLEELKTWLAPISSRVTKDEVLDLPPKLYTTHYFELSPGQRALYETLKKEFLVQMQSGEEVSAPLAIVRLLRLQQIICGYVAVGQDEVTRDEEGELLRKEQHIELIPGPNPRLAALADVVDGIDHKAIIYARFRKDIDLICGMMEATGRNYVRLDGSTKDHMRQRAVERFQDPQDEVQFLVANPAVAGEGLTLHAARTVVFYNNSFKLVERLQAEDRAHRIGQMHPVTYIDLVAEDTVDEKVVDALQRKRDVATLVQGDTLKEWLCQRFTSYR